MRPRRETKHAEPPCVHESPEPQAVGPVGLASLAGIYAFLLVPPKLAALAEPYAGPTTPAFLGQDYKLQCPSLLLTLLRISVRV